MSLIEAFKVFKKIVGITGILFLIPIISISEERKRVFSPNPTSRPYSKSIQLPYRWDEMIRFIVNRGPNEVIFQDELLSLLDPKRIRALGGFKSFKKTRLTLTALEFRSVEVFEKMKALLELGAQVRIVLDGGTVTPISSIKAKDKRKWTKKQRESFLNSYDLDQDGRISSSDVEADAKTKYLAIGIFEKLKALQKKHPGLELILSPAEMVPQDKLFHYPRLYHVKRSFIEFETRSGWSGPVIQMDSSANLTDAGLRRRVESSQENLDRYLAGEEFRYARNSQGHIQFGAIFGEVQQVPEALRALEGPFEEWIKAFKKGKHFNSVPPAQRQYPQLVFEDGSTLQAFYSEGIHPLGSATIDPNWIITRTLSRADIQLTTFYSAQFVFTHKALARHIRSVLAHHAPKDFGIFVDASQAMASYSALPDLSFAPKLQHTQMNLPQKAVQDLPSLPESLDWQNKIMIYRGSSGHVGRHDDKNHLKATYFEYLDFEGQTHYCVVWGSINASQNGAQLNADVQYYFESTDPEVGDQLRPFFEYLFTDSRMHPYGKSLLIHWLSRHFRYSPELYQKVFLERIQRCLNRTCQKRTFSSLYSKLKKTGAKTPTGRLILRYLNWILNHHSKLSQFSWEDLYLVVVIAKQSYANNPSVFEEVKRRWTEGHSAQKRKTAARAFDRIAKSGEKGVEIPPPAHTGEKLVIENCERYLTSVQDGKPIKRREIPIVPVEIK